ncbi:hypothetical protein [Chroococcus sp. FPU101]|uniref:hypothetical protein n=1 Tax=Chroococcus sp. FPU101 TaxID=1974212 RepID=UPI001A8D5948|nr:hypothetical protein [Chroococcus sp. FPU101]GFE70068.1 hypothetical protein CFPU101_26780 [Chroococcus sp. FPU101]
MTIPRHWKQVKDQDEITKIIEDLNHKPLVFALEEGIQSHSETADQFVELVLEVGWAFISDESTLYDFEALNDVTKLEEKIQEVFGVDVSDIEDKNVFKIFERIDSRV